MRKFIFLFSVILIFIEVSVFGWKAIIERSELQYLNDKRLKVIEAKLFKYNRTTRAVTLEIEVFYDLPVDLMIDIKIYGFISNEYRQLPVLINRRVCDTLKLEYQWVKHSLNTNFPDACPVSKGRYYLKDYTVDVSRFPRKPWNINNYKLRTRLYYKKEDEVIFEAYALTTDNDEYAV